MNEQQIQAIAKITAEVLRLGIRDFGICDIRSHYYSSGSSSSICFRLNVMGHTKMHSWNFSVSLQELEEEEYVDWTINSTLKRIAMELGASVLKDADNAP